MAERSTAAGTQRVALLARPGKAADNLADALRQAGADVVLVADPNTLDESALLAAQPHAVLVALEPGIEQAIDRLDAVLSSPALTVIFDEADLAAHRAGWDSARWVRHLSAKLNHHQQVLPPGGEAETEEWYPSPGQLPKPTSAFSDLDLGAFAEEAAVRADSVPTDGMNLENININSITLDSIILDSKGSESPAVESAAVESVGVVSTHSDAAAFSGEARNTALQDTVTFDGNDFEVIDFDAFEQTSASKQAVVESAPPISTVDSFETADLVLAPMDASFDAPMVELLATESPVSPEAPPMRSAFDDLSITTMSFDDFASDTGPMQDLRFDTEPETAADVQGLQIDELVGLGTESQNVQPLQFDDDAFFLEELSASGSKATPFEATPDFDFDLIPEMDTAPSAQPSQAAAGNEFDLDFTDLSFEADAAEPQGSLVPSAAVSPAEQEPAGFALDSFGGLSLAADDAPIQPPAPPRAGGMSHDLTALEARISGLSLVDIETSEDASATAEHALPQSFASPPPIPQQISLPSPPQVPAVAEAMATHATAPASAAMSNVDARGIVLIEAGLGGPDPVRQVLAGLPPTFPMPVLVRLHLQGGRYDRLVTQMERAAALPVMLAEVGDMVRSGCIYFLPEGVGLHALSYGLEFIAHPSPATTIFAALPAEESAVIFLSGSDVNLIEDAIQAADAGALVAAQSPGDCYDGAACADLSSRGAASGLPPELARRLVARWAF
jgi:chemosensory pili system protein ChpB (putative protein-glutamate methylesterase)